jgi:glycolate oxidase
MENNHGHHLPEGFLKELCETLPSSGILSDSDMLGPYQRDHTSGIEGRALLAVRAKSTEEVSRVLALCHRYRVPVTPRGAGTGVTGGAVPLSGGIVLSLEKMNRIVEIDRENSVAVVEPGVITSDLQGAAREEGLMYPPDPASLDSCSMGGNVAENAGGPHAVKYGTTGDYVLGLECVLPDGSIIETGGKYVKNATGYNLTGLLLGSEGTLAVITRILVRLIPNPTETMDLLIPFRDLGSAMNAVQQILSARIVPAVLEFMERDAINLVGKHQGGNIPFPDADAHLLLRLDGFSEAEIHRQLEALHSLPGINPDLVVAAPSGPQREAIWKARRSIREAIEAESPVFFAEDSVVPRSRIAAFITGLKRELDNMDVRSVMFGHAGDGNVHVDILRDDRPDDEWHELVPRAKELIYRAALSLGGTLSGEHGIGAIRREYLHLALSETEIDLYRRLKKAFDPTGILNPGKIYT